MISKKTLFVLGICLCTQLNGQDIMMQGWFWDYPKGAWANQITSKATELGTAGFTHLWFPPHAAASSGTSSNGYDPADLFIGTSTTGLGNLASIVNMCNALNAAGIKPVADMVYNHRDGGQPENNPAVEGWIENYTAAKVNAGDSPYPADRYQCILPIGGTTGLGAGTYYIKIKSASNHSNFYNKWYKIYTYTLKTGFAGLPEQTESEPNGGGGCGQGNNAIQLGRVMHAGVDAAPPPCNVDEFALTITANDMFASDVLFITLPNTNGSSDHYISELWYNGTNVQSQVKYRTFTNHNFHSSGRGKMTWANFRPNGNPTSLSGDNHGMWFYYDYDHTVPSTRDTLNAWTEWSWDYLGVRGVRMDAVKHFDASYVNHMMSYMASKGKSLTMAVGEIYSTNVGEYANWLNNAGSGTRIFDFSLRENLRKACDDGSFDVRNVFQGAAASNGLSPFQVVTFLNNHDFRDGSGFSSLAKENRDLGYAYLLTNNQIGIPCVYYPDYYGYTSGASYNPSYTTGQKPIIDELISIHKNYIYGATTAYYLNAFNAPAAQYNSGVPQKCLIYQLEKGNQDVLVAINFDYFPLNVNINLAGLSGGETFTKIGGNGNQTFTTWPWSGTGRGNLQVPARSFAIWRQGAALPAEWVELTASQQDLDVLVEWTIKGEARSVKHFELQRSTDGVHFNTIGTLPFSSGLSYQYHDKRAAISGKSLYYRINTIDLDGSTQLSPVRELRLMRKQLSITVAPQPARADQVQLIFDVPRSEKYSLTFVDIYGRTIYEKSLDLEPGTQNLQLPALSTSAGIHFVSMRSEYGDITNAVVDLR